MKKKRKVARVRKKFKNLVASISETKTAEIIKTVFAFLFFCALYLGVGYAMAVPYTFLAGWDKSNLFIFVTALILPITLAIIYALHTRWPGHRERAVWIFLGYCLLPVFMNGISIIIKWAGSITAGNFVFKYRYESLIAALIGFALYSLAKNIRQLFSSNKTTPPSKSNPHKTAAISSRKKKRRLNFDSSLLSA